MERGEEDERAPTGRESVRRGPSPLSARFTPLPVPTQVVGGRDGSVGERPVEEERLREEGGEVREGRTGLAAFLTLFLLSPRPTLCPSELTRCLARRRSTLYSSTGFT